ncbi:MAG TPA: sulfotransferase domain-containing protein [Anaerolineales bacterium]|nr:sulfotransferase domain-containing protein [Anaerolineales bacterium]
MKARASHNTMLGYPSSLRFQINSGGRLVRRSARRLAQALRYRQFSFSGIPVLFANSFPKSGTHLLTQILAGFTQIGPAVDSGLPAVVTYDGFTGLQRPPDEILADLERLLPGDIAYGHVHALPEIIDFLARAPFAFYFILRDPRDVVVSHVHYVTDMEPNHIHHPYYKDELTSFAERLKVSIRGRPELAIDFPNIRQRFDPFMAWLDQPNVLTIHYEDFILNRQAALGQVLDFAVRRGFPLQVGRQAALETLESSIDPQRSPTFRSGKTGGWKDQFTEAHKELFKAVTGDLLIRLGYEQSHDW